MKRTLTHCPFCNVELDNEVRDNCTNHECSYRIELYEEWEKGKPTDIDYDVYVSIGNERFIFTSTQYVNGGFRSKLNNLDGDELIVSETFTEPTIETVEAIARRLHKLLVFS